MTFATHVKELMMRNCFIVLLLCFLASSACGQWQEPNTRLVWDAGVRDANINVVLLCCYREGETPDQAVWNVTYNSTDNPELFPQIGASQDVAVRIVEVIQGLAAGKYIFAAAYRNEAGQMSEWATTTPLTIAENVAIPAMIRILTGDNE
jgi:hypothetical protein